MGFDSALGNAGPGLPELLGLEMLVSEAARDIGRNSGLRLSGENAAWLAEANGFDALGPGGGALEGTWGWYGSFVSA